MNNISTGRLVFILIVKLRGVLFQLLSFNNGSNTISFILLKLYPRITLSYRCLSIGLTHAHNVYI